MHKGISIAVPVYKSGSLLTQLVSNIRSQKLLDGSSIEILIIDGENSKVTEQFCENNNLIYIPNPDKDSVTARIKGLKSAKNELVCFLDQDEIFDSDAAIQTRLNKFTEHQSLIILFSSGYCIGDYMSTSNMYSSLFGDPFNQFIYNFPNNSNRIKNLLKKCNFKKVENMILNSRKSDNTKQVIMEFGNMGSVVHRSRLYSCIIRELNPYDLPDLFYILLSNLNTIGILDGDEILHFSSDKWATTRSKINWRIRNNLNFENSNINLSSLSARHGRVNRNGLLLQKMCFVLFNIIPIWSTFAALRLVVKYHRFGFLNIIPLCYYVIFNYGFLKFKLGIRKYSLGNLK
jgi:hypothetical protein